MIATRPFSHSRTIAHCAYMLLGFVLSIGMPLQLTANSARLLDAQWEFRALGNPANTEVKEWHAAQVPGVVHTDLLRNKLIPDPFYQDNESRLQWIGLTDWEYRTTFQADAGTLTAKHVDLIFDGLDTFADVYLNEQPVLHAENMFRRWRIPAKSFLKPGANALRIVFHSPITTMIPKVAALPYQLPSISTFNAGNEQGIATAPFTRKAPYQYGWDWGPRFMTLGIWRPVWIESWDSLRVEDFHILQKKIAPEQASLSAELEIEADAATSATIAVNYQDPSGATKTAVNENVQLDAGANQVSFPLRIAAPKLWYPAGYGAQDRYTFSVSVRTGKKTI